MTADTGLDACRLWLGTEDGVVVVDRTRRGFERVGGGVSGETVREIAVHPEAPERALVACGLRGHGLHGTADGGETFGARGFADAWAWSVAYDPTDPEYAYVGTEPAGLHHGPTDGSAWRRFDAMDALPSREDWSFHRGPFDDGHVNAIALADDARFVVAPVEHGAVAYSRDGGDRWREALVGADAHDALAWDDGRVLLATGSATGGGGLHESDDALATVDTLDAFRGLYVKHLVRDPIDDRVVYVDATSSSGSADARIWRSTDRGRTWTELATPPRAGVTGCTGLAVSPDGAHVLHAHHPDDESGDVAVARVADALDAGHAGTPEGSQPDPWTTLALDVAYVRALAVAPQP